MYHQYCEDLYTEWQNNSLQVEAYLNSYFDLNALPEPYLTFVDLDAPLYFLTTNPGGVMDFQKREKLEYTQATYAELAPVLGARYAANIDGIGTAAVTRIGRMIQLANEGGYSGVMQVEAVPYHSKDFRNKGAFLNNLTDPVLTTYINFLKDFLKDKPVLSVQDGAPNMDRIRQNAWVLFLCDIMSLNIDRAEIIPIKVKSGSQPTVGILWDANSRKGILFNQAANNFPGEEGIAVLKSIIKRNII